MKLPRFDQAIIDIAKLRDYSLNPFHPEGKHKARVFAATLGFSAADAEKLRAMIVAAISTQETIAGEEDEHGERYVVDFATQGLRGMVYNSNGLDYRPRRNGTSHGQLLCEEEVNDGRDQSA